MSHVNKNETYEEFKKRLTVKKTSDDVFTPEPVYNAIVEYCVMQYGINPENIVRPFYPGGDYEHYDYYEGCVVVDNQPFSLTSEIIDFYISKGIKFFIFGPAMFCFNAITRKKISAIIISEDIVYDEETSIPTCFFTNMEPVNVIKTCPWLNKKIKEINSLRNKKKLPKYKYPTNLITSQMIIDIAKGNIDFEIKIDDVRYISALDAQKAIGKTIYGGGYIVSTAAADAVKAAADAVKAPPIVFELSDREKAIVEELDKK